jgi:hypothetical protein
MRLDTIIALEKRRNGICASYRKLALELGFEPSFAGTLSDVINRRHAHVSADAERRVRAALGLPPIRRHYRRPCLSPDPAERLAQLRRLVAETEEELGL